MRRKLVLNLLPILLLAFSAPAQGPAQYVFQIPEFPGMELFNSNPSYLALLSPPFATVTRVYKTKDGGPLDSEKVIKFFEDELSKKGWVPGILQGKPAEPYLTLRTQVFESLEDRTYIHVAGHFSLWVAPKDGMITLVMRRWSISSSDQQSRQRVSQIIDFLKGKIPSVLSEYEAQKVHSDSGWLNDHENEFLTGRELYTLYPKGPNGIDVSSPISVSILTYRDTEVAKSEMKRRKPDLAVPRTLIILGRDKESMIVLGKTLVVIRDHSFKHSERASEIARRLQELVP